MALLKMKLLADIFQRFNVILRMLIFRSTNDRNSHPEVFCKKGVLRNFTNFTGKQLCRSLFLNGLRSFSGPNFSAISPNTGKYGLEKLVGLQLYLKWDSSTGVFL